MQEVVVVWIEKFISVFLGLDILIRIEKEKKIFVEQMR